jgi:hypothetical protein
MPELAPVINTTLPLGMNVRKGRKENEEAKSINST